MGCAISQAADQFSPEETDLINAAEITASVFSFLGSGMIMICYFLFPDLRKFAFRLVFFLSLSDWVAAVAGFLTPVNRDGLLNCGVCLCQAWLLSIFELSSVLWTACISHCLYRVVIHHDRGHRILWFTLRLWTNYLIPNIPAFQLYKHFFSE